MTTRLIVLDLVRHTCINVNSRNPTLVSTFFRYGQAGDFFDYLPTFKAHTGGWPKKKKRFEPVTTNDGPLSRSSVSVEKKCSPVRHCSWSEPYHNLCQRSHRCFSNCVEINNNTVHRSSDRITGTPCLLLPTHCQRLDLHRPTHLPPYTSAHFFCQYYWHWFWRVLSGTSPGFAFVEINTTFMAAFLPMGIAQSFVAKNIYSKCKRQAWSNTTIGHWIDEINDCWRCIGVVLCVQNCCLLSTCATCCSRGWRSIRQSNHHGQWWWHQLQWTRRTGTGRTTRIKDWEECYYCRCRWN